MALILIRAHVRRSQTDAGINALAQEAKLDLVPGVQSWLDKMISGMVADMMIGMAYHAWMTSDDHAKNVQELT